MKLESRRHNGRIVPVGLQSGPVTGTNVPDSAWKSRWRRSLANEFAICARPGIPGAEFVELDSKNHILLESEPAWTRFQEAVLEFMGLGGPGPGGESVFASLSPREREILILMTEGLGNAEIAERLAISEKTVRNHVSNLFDKLGVWTRAQAIVLSHDRGFRP